MLTQWSKFNNQIASPEWPSDERAAKKVITPFENLPTQKSGRVNSLTPAVCVFTSRKTDGLARIKNDAGAYRSENSARAFTFVDEETHSELHQEMQMRPASWRLKAQSQV